MKITASKSPASRNASAVKLPTAYESVRESMNRAFTFSRSAGTRAAAICMSTYKTVGKKACNKENDR